MTATIPESAQALIPQPEKTPAALRVAVTRLDRTALPRFDSHWDDTMAKAKQEYSVLPIRHFTEHWWMWVAVTRWPRLAARLKECERIVADSEERATRRAASAEIGQILETAAQAAQAA